MAQKRKRNKKWIYWLIFLVLLVVAGAVVIIVWKNYFSGDKKDNGMIAETTERREMVEEDAILHGEDESAEDEKKVKQYEGEDPNKAESLTGSIAYAGVVDGKLVVRANIDQFLSGGKCDLRLKKGDDNIYDIEANIISLVSTSTCDGFDIPVKDLGSGKISIVIYLSSGERVGEITGEGEL